MTRTLRTCALLALFGLLAGCDALLTEPAAVGVSVQVTLDPALVGFHDVGGALPPWGTRELWLRLTHGDVTRDTIVVAEVQNGEARATAWLHPDELRGPLEVQAEVRLDHGLALFSGAASVEDLGVASDVHISLSQQQVLATIDPGEIQFGISAFDGSFRTVHYVERATNFDLRSQDAVAVLGAGDGRLHLVDPYSGEDRTVIDPSDESLPGQQLWPRFSPDGEWLYFEGRSINGFTDTLSGVWRIRPEGTDPERLLATESQFISLPFPAPSNDGTRLAFSYNPNGYYLYRLGILNLETKVPTLLDVSNVGPMRWSPDDEWIAYLVVGGFNQIHLVRPDGTGDHRLPVDIIKGTSFDWTDDGKYIVTTSESDYAVRIEVATGNVEALPNLGHVLYVAVAP